MALSWGERARRWSAAAALLLLVLWCAWVGPRRAWATVLDVARAVRGVPVGTLLAAVSLTVVQNVLVALRLHVLSDPPWPPGVTVRRVGFPLLLGAVAPARLGDVAKIATVADGGGVARATGTVLVADKVADGAAGAMALLVGITGGATIGAGTMRRFALFAGAGLALVVAGVALAHRRAPAGSRFRRVVADVLAAVSSPRRMAGAVALAALAWTCEATALKTVAHAAGAPLVLPGALFSLAVLNAAVFVPLLPANAGTFEAALGLALARAGVPGPAALGVAVVHHLCQIGGVALLALATTLLRPREARTGLSAAAKERAIRHYDRRAERYDALVTAGPLRWLRDRERRAVLELAGLGDPAVRTMIDVGCGDGYYTRAGRDAGKVVHAVDAAPRMVERVRAVAHAAYVADVERLDSDVRYDLVLCCGALDFVRQPEAAFDRLCRLCAPGGRLLVLVARCGPCAAPYVLEKRMSGLRVNLFRRESLVDRAARHGLVLSRAVRPLPHNEALLFTARPG